MYKIGELSKLCDIPVKTLRYYDAEGLLTPDEIDKFTGYRYYSPSKLEDCYRIIALKELGFSLDEIRVQLTSDNNGSIIAALSEKLAELKLFIKNAEKQVREIENLKNNLTQGESKMFNIIIRATEKIRVAYLRKNYSSKNEAENHLKLIENSLPKGIVGKRKIIINYETEYKETDLDLAVCAEITGKLPQGSGLSEKNIVFGRETASLICKTDELDEAYKAMIKYIDGSNYKVCGAYYEIYHNDGTVELKVPVSECLENTDDLCSIADITFIDDPEVCGRWEMIDILPTREHFVYGKPKCGHLAWLYELYFIDGGKSYWAVSGWTKGALFTYGPGDKVFVNRYTVEKANGKKLLFLEMNDYGGGSKGGFGAPEIWVYEQTDGRRYVSADELRRSDNTDYPFINDGNILGGWLVRDFVINREDFDTKKQNLPQEELFFLRAEFKENGIFVSETKNGVDSVCSVWTKGLVLNKVEKTASAYAATVIDGREYLFIEWKCGDYSFGGGRVYWYVFTREQACK